MLLLVAACSPADPSARPTIGGSAARGDRVTVEVLNASGVAGLARTATLALREAGLDVVFYGTADTSVDSTQVLVRRGPSGAGERVARALGGGQVRVAGDTLRRVDVTVLLGPDWRAPPLRRP